MTYPTPEGIGWHPYPLDPTKRIFWDGNAWSAPVPADVAETSVPTGTPSAESDKAKKIGIAIGVLVLSVIGLVMSQQPVSLFSGSGQVWTGVALAGVGTAVAFFLGAAKWARVIAIICLVAGLANAIYIETQLSEKRAELTKIFNN